jgi:hypothetical protein
MERDFFLQLNHIDLAVALKQGYRIRDCYQYYQWSGGDENMFKGMVNQFFRIKTLSSPFPKSLKTRTEKEHWIKELNRRYDWEISGKDFERNDVLRFISKRLLNAIWVRRYDRAFFYRIYLIVA